VGRLELPHRLLEPVSQRIEPCRLRLVPAAERLGEGVQEVEICLSTFQISREVAFVGSNPRSVTPWGPCGLLLSTGQLGEHR